MLKYLPDLRRSVEDFPRHTANGYVTLLSVVLMGAIGSAITVGILVSGITSARSGLAKEQSMQARSLATACAEEALETIRESTSYVGTGTLLLGSGACSFTVQLGSGENRTITASSTVGTVARKVSITVSTVTAVIGIASWQEVASF